LFAVDLPRPDRRRRRALARRATGESRASFEGLIQIDPARSRRTTYLQITR